MSLILYQYYNTIEIIMQQLFIINFFKFPATYNVLFVFFNDLFVDSIIMILIDVCIIWWHIA